MIQSLNELALALGYVSLGLIALAAWSLVSFLWSLRDVSVDASADAKAAGERIATETSVPPSFGTMIAAELEDQIDEIGDDVALNYEPRPVARFDWSMADDRLDADHVRKAGGGLRAADLHVHPFPQSPEQVGREEWHWSERHMGVWLEEPTFYIPTDDGRREVDTDLSEWEPDTDDESPRLA